MLFDGKQNRCRNIRFGESPRFFDKNKLIVVINFAILARVPSGLVVSGVDLL